VHCSVTCDCQPSYLPSSLLLLLLLLPAGVAVNCTLELLNSGNATLKDISVASQPSCSWDSYYLAPGEKLACSISTPLTQKQFNDWDEAGLEAVVAVSATALSANTTGVVSAVAGVNVSLPLTSLPSLNVTLITAGPLPVTAGESDASVAG